MKFKILFLLFLMAFSLAGFAQASAISNANLAKSTVTGWFFYFVLFSVALIVVFVSWYYYRSFAAVEKGIEEKPKISYWRIDSRALLNVLIAAIIIGAIVHEGFHFLIMRNPTAITFNLADPENLISICCLQEGESALEEVAYGIQLLASLLWVWLNFQTFCKKSGNS